MKRTTMAIACAAPLLLATAGCAGDRNARTRPIGMSKAINGLERSVCDCGGVEDAKRFRERRKAEAEAQRIIDSKGGRH